MGVWIETLIPRWWHRLRRVTPCMGVWIETLALPLYIIRITSHPVWVCGLKQLSRLVYEVANGHTLYGCVDWNLCIGVAWTHQDCHTLYGCVDWNHFSLAGVGCAKSHTLYGCVDWNSTVSEVSPCSVSHTLYGCVDWNRAQRRQQRRRAGHTLYGCVDWNPGVDFKVSLKNVTPCMGVWIETV